MEPYPTFHYVQGESDKDSGNMNDEGRPIELSFPSFGFPFSLFLLYISHFLFPTLVLPSSEFTHVLSIFN